VQRQGIALFLIAGACAALALAGCGSSSGTSAAEKQAARRAELSGSGRTSGTSHLNPPPPGAPLIVRELYREFPPAHPDPKVKGSAAAIRTGERACAGKTPAEVKEKYLPIALERGGLEAGSPETKMIEEIDRFAKHAKTEASFTAGQLAADAYQATLPRHLQMAGYQGCIYSLAKQLEQQLYPAGGKGSAKSSK
jgi:hypothetical protein